MGYVDEVLAKLKEKNDFDFNNTEIKISDEIIEKINGVSLYTIWQHQL